MKQWSDDGGGGGEWRMAGNDRRLMRRVDYTRGGGRWQCV